MCICDELRGIVCAAHRQRQREVLNEPVPDPTPLAIEDGAQAVEVALRFASTEPYGDLAMNARRAAVIAVQSLIIAGWTPPSQPSNEGDNHDAG